MKTKHAVLYYPPHPFPNTSVMWIEGKGFHSEELADPCYTLYQLADVAYSRFITHLWVVPEYGEFPQTKGNSEWDISIHAPKGKMASASVWKRGHKQKDIEIIFPQHTSWWGEDKRHTWVQDANAHDLLITLHYLETVLGVPVGASPGSIGWSYLKKIHPEWIEEIPGVDLRSCNFTAHAGKDIVWQRPLTDEEKLAPFVHKFDGNSEYPYASTQTDVGVGTPVLLVGEDAARAATHEKGHPQEVGVWNCTVAGAPANPALPTPWPTTKMVGDKWLSGPMIRLFRFMGYRVAIHEGWVFPARHDVMAKWAYDLWDIRQGFLDARWVSKKCAALARRATKQIMNATVGFTAFKGFTDPEEEKRRPDIRLQCVSRSAELVWHNINKIYTTYGVLPVMVYMDAVYYVTSDTEGAQARAHFSKREDKFGGFKHEGCIALTPDVLKMFDRKMSVADRLEVLNKIGWSK